MADPRGFLKFGREGFKYREAKDRIKDYNDVSIMHDHKKSKEQAARCMDCGTPFCNWGCPLGNYIPEWNDKIFTGQWKEAFELLDEASALPEVTSRVCPSPCESACVLGLNDDPVTICNNERQIIETAFAEGYIKPVKPTDRTGKKIAVIGSGPAGLATASFLNRLGHNVTVFEKDDRLGGFMRYGIPDFKLEKNVLDRRIDLWKEEGIEFKTGVEAGGKDLPTEKLKKDFDAVCIAVGCRVARDLQAEGRETKGIYFAMEYLEQSNRRVAGDKIDATEMIDAKGKNVVVIGGGDTGSDCVGTANRQGAKKVTQIEILPKPSVDRPVNQPWPVFPAILKTTSSHEEGVERDWSIMTKEVISENGTVKTLKCVRVEFVKQEGNPRPVLEEVKGSEFEIEADLVVLAMGFTNPDQNILKDINVELTDRSSVKRIGKFGTSEKGVFVAGDAVRGPSLIVWALAEGRDAAREIDNYLAGK